MPPYLTYVLQVNNIRSARSRWRRKFILKKWWTISQNCGEIIFRYYFGLDDLTVLIFDKLVLLLSTVTSFINSPPITQAKATLGGLAFEKLDLAPSLP